MKCFMRKISEHLRHRLRMCIWKYWKKPMTKYKELRKLGITEYNAQWWQTLEEDIIGQQVLQYYTWQYLIKD